MKRFFWLISILLVIIAACSKKEPSIPANNTFDYAFKIIPDVADLTNQDATSQNIDIQYITGTQENITLSLSGLPAGVTDSIVSAKGIPPYSATIYFKANSAALGKYPMTLTGVSESGITKTTTFNLNIVSRKELLIGQWENVYIAVDSNKNNIIDASEIRQTMFNVYFIYNADGTGRRIAISTNEPLTWTLNNNENELMIDTTKTTLETISKQELILSAISGGHKTWNILKKI